MVATDGHRLAVAEIDHKFEGLTREVRPLVLKEGLAVAEVQRLAGEAGEDAEIEFALDESHLFFRAGERSADFADAHRTVPELRSRSAARQQPQSGDRAWRIKRRRPACRATCRHALLHAVKLTVSKEGIELSASSPEYGEAKEMIEKEFTGEPLSIGLNAQYMIDFSGRHAPEGPISLGIKGRTIRRTNASPCR